MTERTKAAAAKPAAKPAAPRASRSKTPKEAAPKKAASPAKKRAASKSPAAKKAAPKKRAASSSPAKKAAPAKKKAPAKKAAAAPKKAAPKKAASPKKAAAPRKAGALIKTKPTYAVLAAKVIAELGGRKGHSVLAILKEAKKKYELPATAALYLRKALVAGKEEKYFGVSPHHALSYTLTEKGRSKLLAPKKRKTARKAAPKKASDSPKKAAPKKAAAKRAPKKAAAESPKKAAAKRAPKNASESASPARGAESSDKEPTVNIAGSKYDHFWQYKEREGVWGNYMLEASDVLEGVYQGYLSNRGDTDVRAVKSGDWEYQVDFLAMKQTNLQHANHTVREIRRVRNTHA
eukprot:TRINITY_DN3952_c0_g1_i1.p1 TRINITY_DN3952_c0_g1~~TRINITY_DN3952_c0_g1_i1.p1  ORF type:complete len:349 (-),score=152.29 TRINITY_DN3952_c0_g1_i1:210-1256(-)